MGKRARKTRWRALDIADDHSDSEESNTNSSAVSSRYSRVSNSTGYYSSKYSYSSQSTPARRRYNQYDAKSTRSSSTTSETNKITFNEDEYTRITTPRQDVLFKKGYLNKPKTYQTQTSTGNSTISTGNSTENGTPDHQATDLDYESQFMFPSGFVDQNGIYYVNSYEPYPLMLFNPPTYYQEFSNTKAKRYSTGSLSESMSPNNEEATSQDMSQSGGEASNSGVSDYSGPPIFNMVYPGYYVNGACTPTGMANGHHHCPPPEPVKKLRKRRERKSSKTIPGDSSEFTDENSCDEQVDKATHSHRVRIPEENPPEAPCSIETTSDKPSNDSMNGWAEQKTETDETNLDQAQPEHKKPPSVLKPDAEEFIPRAYHHQALGAPLKMMPPNFMPIPIVPISGHPAFIPPGFPIHFIPPKIYPTPAPTFTPPIVQESNCEDNDGKIEEITATPSHTPVVEENRTHMKSIDIATVVSKLHAVKQEQQQENPSNQVDERVQKTQTYKRNYYNRYRSSSTQEGLRHKPVPVEKRLVDTEGFQRKSWNKLGRSFNNTKKFHSKEETPVDHPKSVNKLQRISSPSQWISVSSRKKKKNRPLEEIDNDNVDEVLAVETSNELFESYDVNQLVDVIPPSQLEEKRIENILTSIAQSEPNGQVTTPNIDIPEVSEIEKEIIVKIEEAQNVEEVPEPVQQEESIKPKKKSKKGTQKPLMKKVIITDIFEEPATEPTKEAVKKVAKKVEPVKEPSPEPESTEKKSKKKKKNKNKSPANCSTAASEDTYELLADEAEDKTTDDISLELDKLIQRGMFSSLQTNIQESDDFFKSLGQLPPTKPSCTTTSSTKTPDYNRIFQSTIRQFLKPNMVSVEHDIKVDNLRGHNKSSSSSDTADQTAGPHLVIQTPEPEEEEKVEPSGHPDSFEEPVKAEEPVSDNAELDSKMSVTLPSITLAVKEWMSRTRETTPDVEILKSPEEIQKYLDDEEEVTLFGSLDDDEDDLLEFWDNFNCDDNLEKDSVKSGCVDDDTKCCKTCSIDKIKVNGDEDEIEVYESKYGKNETLKFFSEEKAQKEAEKLPHGPRACCILQ